MSLECLRSSLRPFPLRSLTTTVVRSVTSPWWSVTSPLRSVSVSSVPLHTEEAEADELEFEAVL